MPTSTINTATRNAMLDAATGELDSGAGANATYEYGTAGFATVLLVWNLNGTNSFTTAGSSTDGTAELTGQPITASASASGTAAEYRIKDKDGNVIRSGNLDASQAITSGTDYNLSATAVQPAS